MANSVWQKESVKLVRDLCEMMRLRGILPLNKPVHLTSYDCIRQLKSLVPNNKIGHSGTLDPIASGLLLILFNEATKIAEFLSAQDKEYIAKIRLGITTDTDDITGQIIRDRTYDNITQAQVKVTLNSFLGEITQVPPKFAAIKLKGRKGYELARKGIDFIPKPRKIIIKTIELLSFNLPMIEIKTTVSKGTYLRALARDLGEKLGCGATLEELRRIRIGKFTIDNAIALAEIINAQTIVENLYSINDALFDIPIIVGTESEIKKIINGQPISVKSNCQLTIENSLVRIIDNQNRVLIIGRYKARQIYPERLIYAD